jgi:hypothetical protein
VEREYAERKKKKRKKEFERDVTATEGRFIPIPVRDVFFLPHTRTL